MKLMEREDMRSNDMMTAPKVLTTPRLVDVDGMPVRRVFTPGMSAAFDPFLYFVHFGPRQIGETTWGFPAHPHKGFETITYMLEGGLEHRDSNGGHGILGPGDVQWATAGRGIIHSETPPDSFVRAGGMVNGFQIWLNLARAHKSAPAAYQVLRGQEMPIVEPGDGTSLRVIGGAVAGAQSPVHMLTAVDLIHASIDSGACWHQTVTGGHNAFIYVIEGACGIETAGGNAIGEVGQTVLLGADPGVVTITGGNDAHIDLLWLSGAPIGEPVVAHGPFVMSSEDEIMDAIDEYKSGRMGTL